ncbi:hypothetical protein Glove_132g226 [Diversispora epigaea]|uniref:Uncharacterized protein n=1 Tax=Diversispora epigaea TaxID=1348612 RepID=A0A397J745_9GLOM|nr:hypothetical protein Glove_132g226 [Diversispora epigaea]
MVVDSVVAVKVIIEVEVLIVVAVFVQAFKHGKKTVGGNFGGGGDRSGCRRGDNEIHGCRSGGDVTENKNKSTKVTIVVVLKKDSIQHMEVNRNYQSRLLSYQKLPNAYKGTLLERA